MHYSQNVRNLAKALDLSSHNVILYNCIVTQREAVKRKEKSMPTKVGKRLIKLRGKKSRKEIAKALGVSVSAIAMYELGKRLPRDEIKKKIALLFNSSVEDIFFT